RGALVGAEAMRRGVGRLGAAAASHVIKAVPRPVPLVAAGALEDQDPGQHVVDLEGRQPPVAADAVVFVDDGGADAQVGELANDGFRIARRTTSALPLPRPLHAELLRRQHAQLRPRKPYARLELADRDAEPVVARDERAPAGERFRCITAAA